MTTTLITGGAGFIGSHLARRLLAEGESVVVVDNFNDYYDPAIKRARAAALAQHPQAAIIEADIRDLETMRAAVRDHNVTRIAHLAAMANVRASVERGPYYVEVNVNGTVNLLEAARLHGVELFVLASTSSVYGEDSDIPFVETASAARPLAPYPASKRAAELLAHAYHNLFDLNVTALRFFNVYGPDGRPDMMPMKVLDYIINHQEITLFNNGDMRRDWTYIDDTVAGVAAALGRPLGYEVMNLGFGAPVVMTEFIEIMEELTGEKAIIKAVPAPPSDPPITFCNNEKARRLLGFDPQVSLPEGLARTWAWYREQHGL